MTPLVRSKGQKRGTNHLLTSHLWLKGTAGGHRRWFNVVYFPVFQLFSPCLSEGFQTVSSFQQFWYFPILPPSGIFCCVKFFTTFNQMHEKLLCCLVSSTAYSAYSAHLQWPLTSVHPPDEFSEITLSEVTFPQPDQNCSPAGKVSKFSICGKEPLLRSGRGYNFNQSFFPLQLKTFAGASRRPSWIIQMWMRSVEFFPMSKNLPQFFNAKCLNFPPKWIAWLIIIERSEQSTE